ncbi:hypothetical protein D3C76_1407230 [compost metagenome]
MGVGYEAEAAGQTLTLDLNGLVALTDLYRLQLMGTQGGDHMTVGAIPMIEQAEGLPKLFRPARQLRYKRSDINNRSLFCDSNDLRTFVAGGGGGCE